MVPWLVFKVLGPLVARPHSFIGALQGSAEVWPARDRRMKILGLLREEPRARFLPRADAVSARTGAAYVALLLVAYERFHSPWALSLVLLADLMPAMLLGPSSVPQRTGGRADPARGRDLLRFVAFTGIWLVDDFTATLALSLRWPGPAPDSSRPLASRPSQPGRRGADPGSDVAIRGDRRPRLHHGPSNRRDCSPPYWSRGAPVGERRDLCDLRGHPLQAPVRRSQRRAAEGPVVQSLLREAWAGLKAVARMRGVRVVLAGSAAALFFGGVFNVGELLFATDELGVSDSGYSALVAMFGLGFIIGSLTGSGGGSANLLRRRFLLGAFLMGSGFSSAVGAEFAAGLVTFALAGVGNGMLLVHERVIVQGTVSDVLLGRTFGVKDALASWAFGLRVFCCGRSPRRAHQTSGS